MKIPTFFCLCLIIASSPGESATNYLELHGQSVSMRPTKECFWTNCMRFKRLIRKVIGMLPCLSAIYAFLGLWWLFPSPPQISSTPSASILFSWWQHHISWETETVMWWEFLHKVYKSVSICLFLSRAFPPVVLWMLFLIKSLVSSLFSRIS